jgi:DNA ligase (NAD+)
MNVINSIINSDSDPIDSASKLSLSDLEKAIIYASDKYYNTSNPVINDDLFDILVDFLKAKNPKSPVLENIGSVPKSKLKVTLDYWMGSMDKIKPPSKQLDIWTSKYPGPYNLSDKLDGVSALLVYTKSGTIRMYTRGTASEGMDISPLIKYLNLPDYSKVAAYCNKLKISGIKNLLALRGELIINEQLFQSKWASWSKLSTVSKDKFVPMKNARNSVAGLTNSKTINPDLASDTNLVIYEIIEPSYPIETQLKMAKDMGFNIVYNKTITTPISFDFLSKYFQQRKAQSSYQIDGIIVSGCDQYTRNITGNPPYAFAFKNAITDQIAQTTVIEIEWNVSKDGLIKPTVLIEPVKIGGVEIKRVTGINAKYISENKIGPGAQIEVIRSGDVIPKIITILKPSKLKISDILPNVSYEWTPTNVDIVLNNHQTNTQVLVKNIYYFFSKLETKGLGEKNVEKLINSGLNTIPKILAGTLDQFTSVDGLGEKTAQSLINSINTSRNNIPLAKLMAASNKLGHGIGEEKIKQILSIYPNILTEYKKWSSHDFISNIQLVNGWDVKSATQFVTNFKDWMSFYNQINKYITIAPETKSKNSYGSKNSNDKIKQNVFVFTGFRDSQLEQEIEALEGSISSTINKKTTYLIVKDQSMIDDPTDKINKAINLGIKIITRATLIEWLNKLV